MISSNEDKRCRDFGIDEKFIPNYNLSLAAGRNFDKDKPAYEDTTQMVSVIINETAAKILGFASANDAINKVSLLAECQLQDRWGAERLSSAIAAI